MVSVDEGVGTVVAVTPPLLSPHSLTYIQTVELYLSIYSKELFSITSTLRNKSMT